MSTLFDHYKTLGVSVGAGIADVTSSYRQLCRIYHPDVSGNPESEEKMKKINMAYTVLRDKLRREAALRERQSYFRAARRYGSQDAKPFGAEAHKAAVEAEKVAFSVLDGYFKAISLFDYTGAYNYLSSYDKRHISRESYIEWRKSVARLYPMREFKIAGGLPVATMKWGDGKTIIVRRFRVAVTEEDLADEAIHSGDVEKLVVFENGSWRVFLGYDSVGDLTRTFEERFETKCKRNMARRWEEYYTGLCPEYDMLSMAGMRKAVSREMYRQRRYGGGGTFAVISVKAGGARGAGQEELLRCAAATICSALRETDVPAYAGDGVFVILFVELRKKSAQGIISRLIERIRKKAGPQLGVQACIEYAFESWHDNNSVDINTLNGILRKIQKKV